MADGMGAGDLFRSRILGMGLEDTPFQQQQVGGMMGGMTPEQLQAFYQNPQVQAQFKSFGIDPQAMMQGVRQSPFFNNNFMQHHPLMGGMLSHAMANAAATPEAPLVSGAGSGISRAMQGMYGGPEMLRHYQMQQMMGPMGAAAGMMPMYGEQRRRAIEEAIVNSEQQRQKLMPGQQEMQGELADIKRMHAEAAQTRAQAALEAEQTGRPYYDPAAATWMVKHPAQAAQPQGPEQRGPMEGPGALPGVMSPMGPGTPAQEAQPASWGPGIVDDTGRIKAVSNARETDATKDLKGAQANKANAQAAESRYKATPQYKISSELAKSDRWFGQQLTTIDDKYNPMITAVGADTPQGQQLEQQRQNEVASKLANYLVQVQHSGAKNTAEQEQWLQQYMTQGQGQLPAQVSPGMAGTGQAPPKTQAPPAQAKPAPTAPAQPRPSYEY